jgi:hypothetical protein
MMTCGMMTSWLFSTPEAATLLLLQGYVDDVDIIWENDIWTASNLK